MFKIHKVFHIFIGGKFSFSAGFLGHENEKVQDHFEGFALIYADAYGSTFKTLYRYESKHFVLKYATEVCVQILVHFYYNRNRHQFFVVLHDLHSKHLIEHQHYSFRPNTNLYQMFAKQK